jgi:hypothetical protein
VAGAEDSFMSNTQKVGFRAAAIVPAAIIAIGLASCQVGSSEPTATPNVTMTAEPTATPVPRLNGQEPLDPGRYRVNGGISTDVTVAVPSGWSASGDWVVLGPRGNDEPDGMAIRFYTMSNLAVNPLSHSDGNLDPPVGPTVDDMVQAIVAHPGWTASEPTDISIDGHTGQLVSITIHMDVVLPADDTFYLEVEPSGGGIWGWAQGQTFDLYILDVDGQRLIIDSWHYLGTPEEDLAAQRTVVESVQFGSNP